MSKNYLKTSKMLQENFSNCFFFFDKRNGNYEKYACQNMAAMEMSSQVDSDMSY